MHRMFFATLRLHLGFSAKLRILQVSACKMADMEKGADMRTLSAEIFENCGKILILEDYAPLFSEENLFLVEMFDETFDIWHIYSL